MLIVTLDLSYGFGTLDKYAHKPGCRGMHLPGDAKGNSLNSYRIGPLLYVTELPLPELPAAQAETGDRPVTIRIGKTPVSLATALMTSIDCDANASEFLLRIPGVATYLVRDGADVIVEPAPQAPELDVRSYLIGSLFAVICHQRGLLPLHASAVATPAGAVAFLGRSGDGKSSLAAFLARREYRILADDICLIDPSAPQESRVLPVAPWLKLWGNTLDALGETSAGLPRIFVDDDKYRYMLRQEDPPTALAEIILLERTDMHDARTPVFERLAPVHAVQGVLELTYHSWLVHALGQSDAYFLRCAQAIDGVRVTRMRRPWGFDAMDATLDALESHFAARI